MKNDTLRCVESRCEAMWNRVSHGKELDLERPDLLTIPVGDFDEDRVVYESRFLDPVSGQSQSQRRAVDGDHQIAEQERKSAGVVLVTVGEHHSFDAIGALTKVGEVRQDEVDPRHVRIREHDPAVENDYATIELDTGAVASDLSEATEEADPNRRRHSDTRSERNRPINRSRGLIHSMTGAIAYCCATLPQILEHLRHASIQFLGRGP